MMLVSALFGGSAAAGAGTAVAGTAAAVGATSGGLTLLQGIGTIFSAITTIAAGSAQAAELKAQAKQEELKSREEFAAGEEQSAKLKKELALTVQRQQVAFAAGGVDLGSATVDQIRTQTVADAERELGFARGDANRSRLALLTGAENLRRKASMVKSASFLSAFNTALDFGTEVFARG